MYICGKNQELPALPGGQINEDTRVAAEKRLPSEEFMEDGHLASLGGLLHRRLGWLRLFILEIIVVGLFRPGRR